MPVSEVLATDTMVAWAMNGRELEPQHGFPLRYVSAVCVLLYFGLLLIYSE